MKIKNASNFIGHMINEDLDIKEGVYDDLPEDPGDIDLWDDFEDNFIGDYEKMRDFFELDKDQFLASYAYLTEREYDATKAYVDFLLTMAKKSIS